MVSFNSTLCQNTMEENITCPNCQSDLTYEDQGKIICTQCMYEWVPAEETTELSHAVKVLDSNGNELNDGDSVITTKDLVIKGAAKALKMGTKVKNIRLVEGDHNISCKIDGIGAMFLKSEFVKKV